MEYRKVLAKHIYNRLGPDYGGTPSPPGTECSLIFGEPDDDGDPLHIATTHNNDGFELWLGYRLGKWHVFYPDREARKLAFFILWDWWAKATWFGLKRKIWYWALNVEVGKLPSLPEAPQPPARRPRSVL